MRNRLFPISNTLKSSSPAKSPFIRLCIVSSSRKHFTRHFFGREIVAFPKLPKLMFLSFIIFNYSTPRKVSSLKLNEIPSSCCDTLCYRTSFLSFRVHLSQLLLLSLTNFKFTTPRIEPKTIFRSSCRVNRHMYELRWTPCCRTKNSPF